VNTNPHLYGRETYGFSVTKQIASLTAGSLHVVGRLASKEELTERIMEKIAEDQRLIAYKVGHPQQSTRFVTKF
jgi:hypothetical protein